MRNRMFMWLLLGGGAFVLLTVTVLALVFTLSDDDAEFAFGDRLQVVDIAGELVDSTGVIEQLKRYEDTPSVRAILLNIDSPGGGVATAQEIYTEVKRLREKKDKIIVVYMSSVGA